MQICRAVIFFISLLKFTGKVDCRSYLSVTEIFFINSRRKIRRRENYILKFAIIEFLKGITSLGIRRG